MPAYAVLGVTSVTLNAALPWLSTDCLLIIWAFEFMHGTVSR